MDEDKEYLREFSELKFNQRRMESDLQKLMVAFFGNGKDGFEKVFIRFEDKTQNSLDDLKESLREQDILIQKMIDSKEASGLEKTKGYLKLGTDITIVVVQALILLGIWKLTGQIP